MRALFSLLIILTFGPSVFAQDKGKAEFSPSAEYRLRYWWTQNPGADGDGKGAESRAVHRFKIGTLYRANEKFTAGLTLLHNAAWGLDDTAKHVGEKSDAADPDNLLLVNEAYANWMTSEDFNIRFGRQAYQIADGYVIGVNDWLEQPYAFEGVLATYDSEVGRFQGFIFKLRDMGEGVGAPSASKDPEHNTYGVSFDLRSKPEWVKALNFHIIRDSADAIEDGLGTNVEGTQGQESIRYGLMSSATFGFFDGKVWFASHAGKNKLVSTSTPTSEREARGLMAQAEISTTLPSVMDSRFFVQYHYDSGDSDKNDDVDGTYDAYFFERHDNAGLMDLFDWGNLTYLTLGWNGKLSDKTEAGALYTLFSRTETGADSAGPVAGVNGSDLFPDGTTFTFRHGDQAIGTELDIWLEHKYEGGLSTTARLGYFVPDEVIKNMSGGTGTRNDNIVQLMIQGKMTF